MTSNDNSIALQLRELIATNREQIAEMKALSAQIQKDNAEFCATMIKEFTDFKTEVRGDINNFKTGVREDINNFKVEIGTRFDKLEGTIGVIQNDITGLKHDVAGLYHWDYWLLSIILVVFAMPQIVAGVKALFGAVAEGIAGIVAVFRGKG